MDVARGAGLCNTAQWALADLAIEKVYLGDHDTARRLFDEAASASREIGDGAGEVLAGYGYGLLAHVRGLGPSQAALRDRGGRVHRPGHPGRRRGRAGWLGAVPRG